jgi:uncharacterized protein
MAPRFERRDASGPLVRGFAGALFIVGEARHRAVLLTPEASFDWSPPPLADLAVVDFASLLAMTPAPEFILLGTGTSLRRPAAALVRDLQARGVGIEAMDSRAAARTWGVLRAEDRWIAAALMPL